VERLAFDGNGNDSSGVGVNGQVVGGSYVFDRYGLANSALHFDGSTTQHFVAQDSAAIHTPYMTMGLWFRTGSSVEQQIAYKGYFNPANATPEWSLYIDTTRGKPLLAYIIRKNGQFQWALSANALTLTNQWQFAAATWDGTNQVLYLNGEEVGRAPNPAPGPIDLDAQPNQLVLGIANTQPLPFIGELDDFLLYNRSLMPEEIRSLYHLGQTSRATAVAQVAGGFMVQIDVTNPGYGYTNAPLVTITGGGGTGAQATAVISAGSVQSITVDNPGRGYTSVPTVTIDPPQPIQRTRPYPLSQALNFGLIEWLPFDGNLVDVSGYQNDATSTNTIFGADRFGEANSSVEFAGGSPQSVTVPVSDSMTTPLMTAAFWFHSGTKAEQQLVFKGIFSQFNGYPEWGMHIDVLLSAGTRLGYVVKRNGQLYYLLSKDEIAVTNQWQFAAATWDGTTQVIYVNGEEAGRSTAAPQGEIDPDPAGSQLVFGHANTVPYALNGGIDDFKLYNRALSGAEIRQLYQAGSPPQAIAIARVVNGFVVEIVVTNPGSGYTSVPNVTLVGGGGTGAQFTAVLVDGSIQSITVNNPGHGYTSTPVVAIDPPPPQIPPTSLELTIKTVNIVFHVNIGRTYQVESSSDTQNWTAIGSPFVASSASFTRDFDVVQAQSFFRIRDITAP
jgi:hypothetical protein